MGVVEVGSRFWVKEFLVGRKLKEVRHSCKTVISLATSGSIRFSFAESQGESFKQKVSFANSGRIYTGITSASIMSFKSNRTVTRWYKRTIVFVAPVH